MKNQAGLHRWDRILELSHDLYAVTDSQGRLTSLNPAWQRLLQFSQDELLGRPFLDIVHPDDRAPAAHAIESVMATPSVDDLVLRCTARDGTARQVSWRITPVREEQVVYWLGRELIRRTRADAGPHGDPWLFRAMMEQSPLPIELMAPDGRVTAVNTAWRRMWDISEEEASEFIRRYNILEDAQADDLGVGALIRKAFAGESVILPPIKYSAGLAGEQVGLKFSSGASPWIQCYMFPVKDEHEAVELVVNTYIDLTSLKHAEQRARKLKPALQDVFRLALDREAADRALRVDAVAALDKLGALTPREREVLVQVIAGKPNKAIASDLGVSLVTVKVHRGRVMHKLRVTSLAELVRICEQAGLLPSL